MENHIKSDFTRIFEKKEDLYETCKVRLACGV